jgi:hypothetical protein
LRLAARDPAHRLAERGEPHADVERAHSGPDRDATARIGSSCGSGGTPADATVA